MSIQRELEDGVAAELESLGLTVYRGIIRQTVADSRPEKGDLLFGERRVPFASVSSPIEERILPGVSYTQLTAFERVVSVVLFCDRLTFEADGETYVEYREKAIHRLNLNRFRGSFDGAPESCILQGVVRPRSIAAQRAWIEDGIHIAGFDVLFRTLETPA